jgi:hypothetical protein
MSDATPTPEPTPTPTPTPVPTPTPTPTPTPVPAAAWPDDWRAKLAGDDAKLKTRLERFTEPGGVVKSWLSAEQKLSSGEYKKVAPLAADATPEQIAEYRKEHGVPEKPEAYLENLPNGLVIGESDKARATSLASELHKLHAPPALVHKMLEWNNADVQARADALSEQDETQRTATEDALRADWDKDYRPNINAVHTLLEAALDEKTHEALMNARAPDGSALMNNPAIVKALATWARELNPPVSIPGGSGDQLTAVIDRIADIKKLMGNKASEYWKGDKAPGLQNEYRQLVEARDKLKKRTAA